MRAEEIRRHRALLGWTRAELARRASISSGHLARIESGRAKPAPATIEVLDRALALAAAPTMGAFVRARRRVNGLTQRELAELAGVGVRLVSELERDKPTLRLDAVNAVLAVFGKQLGIIDTTSGDGAP